ncbi:hypothetical protein AY599_17580 [Leptolyngbya valderiana BDU 20041]|nr:tetratricopeptide repeat protein [Geitlerinema sp. CS-897]OAB61469.1 hypothetical protein AY599_17580 [Leptolyngbya valderiana BDU 20041]
MGVLETMMTQGIFGDDRLSASVRSLLVGGTSALMLAVSSLASVAIAGDPFRSENPHDIGDKTEKAFEAFFKDSHYPNAEAYLDDALESEADDPIVPAMKASLLYLKEPDELEAEFQEYAAATLAAADALLENDPLRGNIYLAVGHFLEGGYILKTEGVVRGVPKALQKLQLVFQHLDRAADIDATDPELNIIKGYMDLMLAVSLPFANPDRPIERLREHAAPEYLAQRGLAVGYRDLERLDEAMEAVDRTLELTPSNPEVMYLKGQIYVEKGQHAESLAWFDRALAMREQLLDDLVRQIERERNKAQREVEENGDAPEAS